MSTVAKVTEQQTTHADAKTPVEATPAPKPGDMTDAEAQKVLDAAKVGPPPAGTETVDGNKAKGAPAEPSGVTDPTGEPAEAAAAAEGETPAEGATELTPRLQKALDSVKGSDEYKKALAADSVALEQVAKQREAMARTFGKLGAYTREANRAKAAAETTPAPATPAPAAKVETEPETTFEPLTEDAFYEKGPKVVDSLRKENVALRKMFGDLTERLDARDKRDQDDREIHQTQVFDDFLAELDPKVYPQYGVGSYIDIPADDPAREVRNGLWTEFLDVFEDAEDKGNRLTDAEALETAFFHIHRETPTKRIPKATAKKPTATVRPTGNPPVRTPREAEKADARGILGAFTKGEPLNR